MKQRTLKELANFFECGVCLSFNEDGTGIDLLIGITIDGLGGCDDVESSLCFADIDEACEYLGLDKDDVYRNKGFDLNYFKGTLTYPTKTREESDETVQ